MSCKAPLKFFPPIKSVALPNGSMENKIALVTGGGTGLGKSIATTFASLGAKVAICGRRNNVLTSTANEIGAATGAQIEPFPMDIRDPKMVSDTLDAIEKKFGSLPNVLVNNAAANFIAPTERLSMNAVKTIVDIVLMGTMNVTIQLGKRLIEKGEGCNVLSITAPYARSGSPFVVPSAVAKAGVENMTRSLASEWAKYGIRMNVLALGPIPTKGAIGNLTDFTYEEALAMMAERVPLGRGNHNQNFRPGAHEELGNVASLICSDYGSWFNGSIIDYDGGQQHFNHNASPFDFKLYSLSGDDWKKLEQELRSRRGRK